MTRQKYSIEEALERILRSLTGKIPSDDSPNKLSGQVNSWNISLSDIAELLQGSLPSNSFILPKTDSPRVFAYLPNETNTPVYASGTYVPVSGTFTNTPLVGFTGSGDRIIYAGTDTREFEIDWHSSVVKSAGTSTVHIGIKINGVLEESSVMGTVVTTAILQMSGTTVVTLSPGDTVQIVITSSQADTITVLHFTTTIRPFQ